jgi:hypothetical protein
MKDIRRNEGSYFGLDLCLLCQEALEFVRLLLNVDVGVNP